MPTFTLAIATVKTAYDTFVTAKAATATAAAAIVSAGAEPTPPTVVGADADWNSYVTSNLSWLSTNATLQTALFNAQVTQRTAELAVITALGYNTANTLSTQALNEWIHVTGSGGGVLTYSHWIGASANSTYLTISTILPTQAFPNT